MLSRFFFLVVLFILYFQICYPLMDSLLFWSTSTAAYARDGLANCRGDLSIQNLVMEILCKMCAHADNMNLLLATPPIHRITLLFSKLTKLLTETDQVCISVQRAIFSFPSNTHVEKDLILSFYNSILTHEEHELWVVVYAHV